MRRIYPYLQEPYFGNLNQEQKKRKILALIDNFVNQRQYVKMTLLDWEENPIKEIEGFISGGNISKDGNSSVRRTCNLSCAVDAESYNVDSLQMDFALNKKIFIEIGIKNETKYYSSYPILWFPQGVFYINSFSMNSSTTSVVNISLVLKDKMCLLNGDVAGKFSDTIILDTMTTQLKTGEEVEQKVLLYNLITELVNHFGGEDLNNIVIEDVPLRIKEVMQWNGTVPLYGQITNDLDVDENVIGIQYLYDTNKPSGEYVEYSQGDDIGYIYSDFVYTDELTASFGDTITSVLDKIKSYLGNYEYFYDEQGIFHFREIKNYLNTTQAEYAIEEMTNQSYGYITSSQGNFLLKGGSEKQYLVDTTNEKEIYSFADDVNITSITVTPQYNNIKNDFIVHGIRKSSSENLQTTIRYHVVIDDLPETVEQIMIGKTSDGEPIYRWSYGSFENVCYYTDSAGINKLGIYIDAPNNILPNVGNMDLIYKVIEPVYIYDADDNIQQDANGNPKTDGTQDVLYYWDGTANVWKELTLKTDSDEEPVSAIIYQASTDPDEPYYQSVYPTFDWRTFLYLQGLQANANGTDPGYYFAELEAFWPMEYDLAREKQKFFGAEEDNKVLHKTLSQGNYFLDFIDAASSQLGQYSVNAIGRRVNTTYDENINCLFAPEIPNVVILNKDDALNTGSSENTMITDDLTYSSVEELNTILQIQKDECNKNNQPWTQVSGEVYSNLITGGYANGAYDQIKYELYNHTTYQKTVSLTTLPIFYLNPNTRIQLNDSVTNTYGDFMIQSISLTLGPGANMALTLSEIRERF